MLNFWNSKRFILNFIMRTLVLVFTCLGVIHSSASTMTQLDGTITLFGPQRFIRGKGQPITETNEFDLPENVHPPFLMYVTASDADQGTNARIQLNGQLIFSGAINNRDKTSQVIAVDLQEDNTLAVKLLGKPDSYINVWITAAETADKTPPVIVITSPLQDAVISATEVSVSGTINDQSTTNVTVNDVAATVTNNQTFTAVVPLISEGQNILTAVATDAAGNTSNTSVTVIRDTTQPILTVNAPVDGSVVAQQSVNVSGGVSDQTPVSVNVNGISIAVDGSGNFSGAVPLAEGLNELTITATDAAENTSSTIRNITRDTLPPILNVLSPLDGATVDAPTINVSGIVQDATSVTVSANGTSLNVVNGAFSGDVSLTVGPNVITVLASDAAGNMITETRNITRSGGVTLPPDPSTVAPPIDRTVSTTIWDSTAFLYTGSDPIQTDVVPGTIEPVRAAVIRGKVMIRDETPLAGVTITILDHPEYGRTLSRADGMFDMAVNGGGQLTVKYEKTDYLPLQRKVDVPWQDYAWLPDVAMISLDPNVTTIDLTSNQMQVAQASVITDSRGTRQETLLFPAGTTALMNLPDGTTQALNTLHVRSTEYTVGPNGEKAMPAELPANSAYTYATEFSVDEVIAAGGTGPSFSQPIISYNENFLNFPIGIAVPMGFYDRSQSVWIASDNGRVVKILSITDGKADLDIDGNGIAADATALAALGVTDEERTELITLYTVGQSLWRTPITHFSAWDKNQGTSCKEPCPKSLSPQPQLLPLDNPSCQAGSIIGCQSQSLGEIVDVTGTPFSLHYQSDRVPGYQDPDSVLIPITGPDPTSWGTATRIDLHIFVAGRAFTHSFTPTTNLSYRFTWDGKDAYGRTVQGKQTITIANCYIYPLVYQTTDRFGYNGNETLSITVFDSEFIPCTKWQGKISAWDTSTAEGLGGWSLNVHHSYDPIGHVLYLGDGERHSTLNMSPLITTIAGGPTVSPYDVSDGIPASQAPLFTPSDVIVGPEGSIYISDWTGAWVRKIDTNGIITTVAGLSPQNGAARHGYNGDGIPAIQAKLNHPEQLALGPDGSLYIADSFNNRIRRVSPDGIISTVAGGNCPNYIGDPGGQQCTGGYDGDGGLATQAKLNHPTGVAVAPDGSVYIADQDNNRIRRVTTDGIISTVAGTGDLAFSGDGGLATEATLKIPNRVAVARNGTLYINDYFNWRIRQVGVNGIITTAAGTGLGTYCNGCAANTSEIIFPKSISVAPDGALYLTQLDNDAYAFDPRHRVRRIGQDGTIVTIVGGAYSSTAGDGGPALNGYLATPSGVAQSPDGTLYIIEATGIGSFGQARLRKVTPILPGYIDVAISVASADGSELYMFDRNGRHLRTLDTLTGATLYKFGYDNVGLLVSVTDRDGNVTTIERDANGKATDILGPYGQQTDLTTDPNGYLASITNPAGEAYHFSSTTDGLLTSFADPKGNTHTFTYDNLGRLIRDDDPAGGYKTLVRTETASNFNVTVSSALNTTTQYQVNYPPTGDLEEANTLPSGNTTTYVKKLDGTITNIAADGTMSSTQLGPDPRWGLQAPLGSATLTTPGGLSALYLTSSNVTLSDPANPLSLTNLTNTFTINGRSYTSAYDAVNRMFTNTTPTGRQTFANLDALGRFIQTQTAGLLPANFSYDNQGRLLTVTQGTGIETRSINLSYNSDGYLETVTDPLGRITRFTYDAAGRVITQTLPDGRVIGYSYDPNGNMTGITPPGRPAHNFTYTSIDLTASYTPPSIGTTPTRTLYNYNADRQLTLVTRPDGQTISLGYDNAGRLNSLTFPRGSYSYAYNPITGNLSSIGAPDGINLAYTFDGTLPLSETLSGPVAGSITRTYDNNFRVTGLAVNGDNITYSYDNDNLLTSVGNLGLSHNTQNGLLTGSTLGNVSDARSYDGFGEVTDYNATYAGANLFNQQYSYDQLGRIISKTETIDGTTDVYSYTYDPAGRLSEVARNGMTISSYSYDSNGNRLTYTGANGVISGIYDAQDRLLTYGPNNYTYAANGELLTKTDGAQTTHYEYDALGNLTAVTLPDGTQINYLVDGRDRRIGKQVNGVLVQGFLYQDGLRPIAELDGNGNMISRFVYASHSNFPDYIIKGGATYRIVADQLGSPRLVVNIFTGEIMQRMDYDEFGVVLADTNPGFQPFGFAGGLYDRDTKLVRFGARDYDSETGKWTAKDPLLFFGNDLNLYEYALGDPINLIDPKGRSWRDLALGACLAFRVGCGIAPSPEGPEELPENPSGIEDVQPLSGEPAGSGTGPIPPGGDPPTGPNLPTGPELPEYGPELPEEMPEFTPEGWWGEWIPAIGADFSECVVPIFFNPLLIPKDPSGQDLRT